MSFEFENYTIITSQCKGPNYPAGPCCKAFKEFACPFVDELNDISNICSETMFSYITLIGNYTADLFGSICVEGKDGLDCSEFLPPEPDDTTSGAGATHNTHQLLVFTTSFLVPLLSMLWIPFLQIKKKLACTSKVLLSVSRHSLRAPKCQKHQGVNSKLPLKWCWCACLDDSDHQQGRNVIFSGNQDTSG